jgi:predicted site-specific integrase-resolvase
MPTDLRAELVALIEALPADGETARMKLAAQRLGVDWRTVYRWRSGERPVSVMAIRLARLVLTSDRLASRAGAET